MNENMLSILEAHEQYMYDKYHIEYLLNYATAHIVYDDWNTDNHSIYFCLDNIKELKLNPHSKDCPAIFEDLSEELCQEILADSEILLYKLLEIPEEDRWIYDEDEEL